MTEQQRTEILRLGLAYERLTGVEIEELSLLRRGKRVKDVGYAIQNIDDLLHCEVMNQMAHVSQKKLIAIADILSKPE